MNQELQPLFNLDAVKVAVGNTPDPEVATLTKRRQFSEAYKRRIVREANACKVLGETGTRCAGSALPRWLFQPLAIGRLVAH